MMIKSFNHLIDKLTPRILTQVCRDPNSKTYGCFDRNWWHYKIRDFSSIILQQGGYYCCLLADNENYIRQKKELELIALASVKFWMRKALKYGAFEEYYPWENGYPPLAFSTLAITKICNKLDYSSNEMDLCLKKASKQLVRKYENKALNQQVAGLAALCNIYAYNNTFVSDESIMTLLNKIIEEQNEDGWFPEYGGPDIGYLSVTIDCLWDIYDIFQDQRIIKSIKKAIIFIDNVLFENSSIGMHNSRNTDYIVPYGIFRTYINKNIKCHRESESIINKIFQNLNKKNHYIYAIDDRYWIHYIGHSYVRATNIINQYKIEIASFEKKDNKENLNIYPSSGYIIKKGRLLSYIISSSKGGNISAKIKSGNYKKFSDFGWVIRMDKKQYVTCWWGNSELKVNFKNRYLIKGYLVATKETVSNPFYHVILRFMSLLFGNFIISFLKKKLIFIKNSDFYPFERDIVFEKDTIIIKDKFYNLSSNVEIVRAPRSSKRHVASADSFHMEDNSLISNMIIKEKREKKKNYFLIISNYEY